MKNWLKIVSVFACCFCAAAPASTVAKRNAPNKPSFAIDRLALDAPYQTSSTEKLLFEQYGPSDASLMPFYVEVGIPTESTRNLIFVLPEAFNKLFTTVKHGGTSPPQNPSPGRICQVTYFKYGKPNQEYFVDFEVMGLVLEQQLYHYKASPSVADASAFTKSPVTTDPHAATNPPSPQITVVYPREGAIISSPRTFLLGSVPPGSTLTCNGNPVRLNKNGFFAHCVALSPGSNKFNLNLTSSTQPTQVVQPTQRVVSITTPVPRTPIGPGVLKIDSAPLEPSKDLGLTSGDLIALSVHATPYSTVTAEIGDRIIQLKPFSAGSTKNKPEINPDLVTEYGKTYQGSKSSQADLFSGIYKVAPADHWQNEVVRYCASLNGKKVTVAGKAKSTIVAQPILAHTIGDPTIVRVGPDQGRTTPLGSGVRMMVDGWQADAMRCWLAPGNHVWISRSELEFDENMPLPPRTAVRTINVLDSDKECQIRIPLNQRLPYQIEQQLKPDGLVLRIYGATSDTDWITNSAPGAKSQIVDNVTCRQLSDYVFELTAHLKNRQWGFWADYDHTTLVLHVKSPPHLVTGGARLKGLVVCVDPGHGGSESGALGPSGIKESTINLFMASELASLLEHEGVSVIMTRRNDNDNPSLQERPNAAVANGADLLISIHNNALPDNCDPWSEYGTSTYWYHPQAIRLAQVLKSSLVHNLNLRDYGTFFQNLALARPSSEISCLVEVGFMTNPDEYARLIDPEFQKQAAAAILQGVESYIDESTQH